VGGLVSLVTGPWLTLAATLEKIGSGPLNRATGSSQAKPSQACLLQRSKKLARYVGGTTGALVHSEDVEAKGLRDVQQKCALHCIPFQGLEGL
jgi:hypothetical protein